MPSALFIQRLMAKTRERQGGRVVIAGQSYPMTTRSLEKREREYLPSGLDNAADTDLRVFCVTPTDFEDVGGLPAWPPIGSGATWEGIAYTVFAVHPGDDVIGQTLMKLELFAYKTPLGDAGSTETILEAAAAGQPAAAGKRREYSLPPSTL